MKGLPLEALKCGNQLGACALGKSGAPAIDRIADQRMSDMRHVNPDLMGAAGLQLHFDQGVGRKSLVDAIVSDGGFPIGANRKAFTVTAVASNRKVNRPSPGQGALDQRQILAMDGVRLQLFNQQLVRLDGAGHHQKAAGVLVDPMHDP